MPRHQIKRLLPRHHRIVELCLQGLSQKAIADELKMSTVGIQLIVNAPMFQDQLARRRKQRNRAEDDGAARASEKAQDVLIGAAVRAAEKHETLLESEDERVAQGSANSILDRVGLGRVDRGVSTPTIVLEAEKVELLQIALQESGGGEIEEIIDVEVENALPREEKEAQKDEKE
jgi:hypothetical protein